MIKDFEKWNEVKKVLDKKESAPTFKEREIWWCSIGLNIGHEENGKNIDYSRPILVVKKFNNDFFLGSPLTTKIKEKHYYRKISFKEKEQCVMLSQTRPYASRRLINKMGDLSGKQFFEIRAALKDMFS